MTDGLRGKRAVQIALTLCLPRDGQTVHVARHIVKTAMQELGVERECTGDVEIAVTEACTNVLDHSGPGDEYEVNVNIDEAKVVIRVVDTGRGFDFESVGADGSGPRAERGRGIQLMHALVDRVQFTSQPESGTIVHLEKQLTMGDGSLVQRLVGEG